MLDGFQAHESVCRWVSLRHSLLNGTTLLLLCSICQASHRLVRFNVGVAAQEPEYQELCHWVVSLQTGYLSGHPSLGPVSNRDVSGPLSILVVGF